MKKSISLLLVIVLLAFLVLTNPTTEEFVAWYGEQTALDEDASIMEQTMATFVSLLAKRADRDNYLICSVFNYGGHKTLGIGLRFFPIDDLSEQMADLRSEYAQWLDANFR